MNERSEPEPAETSNQRYTWPWFVLGAVLLGIVLAVLWLSAEIRRTQRLKDFNAPAPAGSTNKI
jgi:hypothetical protein